MNIALRIEQAVGRLIGVGRMRVHPLFLLLLFGAYFVHMLKEALVLFSVIILHELGHAIMAKTLGYEVEEVSLLPFGGVAKLAYARIGFRPKDEALVAIAGPFVNLLLAIVGSICFLFGLWDSSFYDLWMQTNMWIGAFNLLPALPLDGGRILRAAQSRRIGYEQSTVEAYHMAFALSVLLMLIGIVALFTGHPHVGMMMLGVFLFITAWRGKLDIRRETMRFLDAKRRENKHVTKMQSLAVSRNTTIRDVVVQFSPDRYHVLYILGNDGLVSAVLEEVEVLDAVFEGRWLEPVSTLIDPVS